MEEKLKEKFEYVWKNTEVLKPAERTLFTFGDTGLPYVLVAKSLLREGDTVVREGEVITKRPLVLKPYANHPFFEGFGEHEEEMGLFLIQRLAYIPPYKYTHGSKKVYVASEPIEAVIAKLRGKLARKEDRLTALVRGIADMWEVSVIKYAAEMMMKSLPSNITELKEKGMLE